MKHLLSLLNGDFILQQHRKQKRASKADPAGRFTNRKRAAQPGGLRMFEIKELLNKTKQQLDFVSSQADSVRDPADLSQPPQLEEGGWENQMPAQEEEWEGGQENFEAVIQEQLGNIEDYKEALKQSQEAKAEVRLADLVNTIIFDAQGDNSIDFHIS